MSKLSFVAAHAAGAGDLIYTADGSHVITAGADKIIAVRNKSDLGSKPSLEIKDVDHPITCLALSKDGQQLVCGSEGHMVKAFSLPDGKFEKNIVRMTLPIQDIDFSPNGVYLAVASEESDIRLMNMMDVTQLIKLEGHAGPVRCVHFDPNCTFLASSSADGSVRVWRIGDKMVMATFRDLPIVGAPFQFSKIAWSPCGSYLAMPGDRGRVDIKARDSWDTAFTLKGHREAVDVISWSPNGNYLLTACLGKQILLWDAGSHESIGKFICEEQIAQICWSPNENAFTVIDVNGNIATESGVVPSHMSMPFSSAGSIVVGAAPPATTKKPQTGLGSGSSDKAPAAVPSGGAAASSSGADSGPMRKSAPSKFVIDDDDDDDDDDEGDQQTASSKQRLQRLARAKDHKVNKKGGSIFSISALKSQYGVESDDDELQEQEEALELEEYLREQRNRAAAGHVNYGGGGGGSDGKEMHVVTKVVSAGVKPQAPFQPGSTPRDDSRRRFLAWNSVGSIVSREEDTFSSIEIDFADKAANRTVRITDHYGFTMAALGTQGVVFASPMQKADDDDGEKKKKSFSSSNKKKDKKKTTPSTIFFRPFSSWAQKSEWIMQLPDGESALAVAVCDTFVAVATNQQYLRIYRTSGLQHHPILLPGPIVSMVGHGTDELAFVYHRAGPVGKTQNLAACVYRIGKKKHVVSGVTLPLRPATTLTWLGFSENGALHATDSRGLVVALQRAFDWQWVPVLDTATNPTLKSRGSLHWPIHVSGGRFTCVVIKADSNHGRLVPSASPKPVPTVVSLAVPLARLDTDIGRIEAQHLQDELELAALLRASENEITPDIRTKLSAMDTNVLKLVYAAAQKGRLVRALDLAMQLKLRRSYQLAVQLAQRVHNESLATRINVAMRMQFGDSATLSSGSKAVAVDEQSESSSDEEEVDLSAVEPVPSDELGGKKKKVRRANARNYSRNAKKSTKKQPTIFGATKPAGKAAVASNDVAEKPTGATSTENTPAKKPSSGKTAKANKSYTLSSSDEDEGDVEETTKNPSADDASNTGPEGGGSDATTLTPAAASLTLSSTEKSAAAAGSGKAIRRVNPFAQNDVSSRASTGVQSSKTPSKRPGSVLDAIADLGSKPSTHSAPSPSPIKKRPALTRSASFAAEARKKQGTIFSKTVGGGPASEAVDREKAQQARERRSKKMHDIRA